MILHCKRVFKFAFYEHLPPAGFIYTRNWAKCTLTINRITTLLSYCYFLYECSEVLDTNLAKESNWIKLFKNEYNPWPLTLSKKSRKVWSDSRTVRGCSPFVVCFSGYPGGYTNGEKAKIWQITLDSEKGTVFCS